MNRKHIKLWTGLGSFTCLAATVATAATTGESVKSSVFAQDADHLPLMAQGGEGGEAGAMPGSYKLLSTDPATYGFDVSTQVANYADLVHSSYAKALADAKTMQVAVARFLDKPDEAGLEKARQTWTKARPAYLVTEVFRFYDGPIDVAADGSPGPESRINAWPLNEAFIDSVKGRPRSGLVWDESIELTRESIMSRDQVSDESDVTTGWHAIEFLLWGQDLSESGPGERPHTDYLPGETHRDRRRLYLQTTVQMLIDDLASLEAGWAPGQDNYRKQFLALEPREALGRAINGAANLVGHELAIERLAVALDSGDQEDEHSCFSDTTHQDHLYDLRGAYNVWRGSPNEEESPHSIRALTQRVDPELAAQTDQLFSVALAAVAMMDKPFDSILASEPGSPKRQRAEAAVTAFQALGTQLAKLGQRLGVLVIVPGLEIGQG